VRVIDRQNNETDYSYVVPGHFTSFSNASVNCSDNSYSVNCSGTGSTSGFTTPGALVPFQVRGATLTLLLPDGRGAVVNCESKFAERMAGPRGNHRSCRVPLVQAIEAEFRGNKAKLEWVVSLDGKRKESETYKVLAVLGEANDAGTSQPTTNSATASGELHQQTERVVASQVAHTNPPVPTAAPAATIPLTVDSAPSGADILVDGEFVGSTPSSIPVTMGSHEISVKKKGYATWTRKMNIQGGNVHLNADLDREN